MTLSRQVDIGLRLILCEPDLNTAFLVLMQHWAGVSMVAAICICELHFQLAIIRKFYRRAEGFAWSQLVLAKRCAGIIHDNGGQWAGAGIDQLDRHHMSAASSEEGKQQ